MKTISKTKYKLLEIANESFLPNVLEPNVFYYVDWLRGSSHICPCGCGEEVYLPIKEGEWNLDKHENGLFTLAPSVYRRDGCKSHYVINDGIAIILQPNL